MYSNPSEGHTISIHALREEGDPQDHDHNQRRRHFYPRPPRGGRRSKYRMCRQLDSFLSTPSARRATGNWPVRRTQQRKFLSTPSARRATPGPARRSAGWTISIHALREEGDLAALLCHHLDAGFLSTPSARRATYIDDDDVVRGSFLSTPSARRATVHPVRTNLRRQNFYPRPPRGGRHANPQPERRNSHISIHALREEGDPPFPIFAQKIMRFLSTPSARRATQGQRSSHCGHQISIHALREEGDGRALIDCPQSTQFLSTPSARRATAKTETKSLFSNKLYNILHEFRRALIYNGSKSYPNHAK